MRPGTVFYKLTGSGNDFIALDGRHTPLGSVRPDLVAAICDRRHGVGADGLMVLAPSPVARVHFSFHFWNSDGSEGPMCGNGALCATRLASLLGVAPADETVIFSTPAGLHRGRLVGEDLSEIELPDADLPKPLPAVSTEPGERTPRFGVPSVPHLVLEVEDVESVDVARRGPPLRHDPAFGPGGANVNWVSRLTGGVWRMRTFERGVEAETLACGTGAVASALAVTPREPGRLHCRVVTRSGLPLEVFWELAGDRATSITLRGESRLVYRGVLEHFLNPGWE